MTGLCRPEVKIMMSHDPEGLAGMCETLCTTCFGSILLAGKMGPKMQLPDNVVVHEPKEETVPMMPPQEQEEQQHGGYNNQDYNQGGYNQGGYNQGGYNQGYQNQDGY